MAKPQLIISGSVALDRIMNFSGKYRDLIQPDKLHVLSLSVLLDKMEVSRGGIGANIAYGTALLGDNPVLLGSVGPDAADYVKFLEEAGVDTSHVHVSNLPTASFNVMTDSEDNQVGGFYPGAMGDAASLSLKEWAGQDVFVCISAHDPKQMRKQAEECQQLGLRLMYDPGQQVSNSAAEDLQAGIDAAEVLTVNDYEMGVLCKVTGTTPEQLKSKIPIVITTLGKEGSVIEGTKVAEPVKIPSVKPGEVVDPTGAGDAYRAGFLHGYLNGWPLDRAGRLGAVTASFIIEHHGTQTRFSKQDIIKRYRSAFKEEIEL